VYEEDRDALTAQFDAADAMLKEIQTETAAVRVAVEEQKQKVDKTTRDVEAVVKEMHDEELKTRDEMREIREEVNNIREMLPRVSLAAALSCSAHEISQMIEKNKDSQTQSLAELQQELKSLKALLLSRGSGLSPSPSSPLPFSGRPSIPAWQLAGPSSGANGSDLSATSTGLFSSGSTIPSVNDKGKAAEMTPEDSSSS
jgi:peroxin-14